MAFIRFILARRHPQSGVEEGLFRIGHRMRDDANVSEDDRVELSALLSGLGATCRRLNASPRSKSKGYYRRATRGIAWFKDTSTECLAKIDRVKHILESYGHAVTMIRETRVGYVVYEDDLQVIAEPFSETDTRGS